MKVFIPEILSLDSLRHRDKYYYLISTITYRMIFDKSIKADGFVTIWAKVWHDIINSRYKERVNELIELGVIEVNKSYWKGSYCKSYRLTELYRGVKLKAVFIQDEKIITNVRHFKEVRIANNPNPQREYIQNNLKDISILDEAYQLLDKNYLSDKQFNYYKIMLDSIREKDWMNIPPSVSGRIYNNITCLPKIFRGYLRYQNKPLAELDVRNSQPFIFNLLIEAYNLNIPINPITPLPISFSTSITTSIYPTTFSDVMHYKELTTSGQFYEYLMDRFTKGYEKFDYLLDDLSYLDERDVFKEKLFGRVFYCYESDLWVSNESIQFKEMFPKVSQIISYHKKDNYKDLANLLQKIEAEIMIKNVVGRLMAENIFCLTIHDSVLCLPEKADKVKCIMEEEFQNSIGLIPQIRIKN